MKFEELAKTFVYKALPGSEVELVGEVPFAVIAPYREHALRDIASEIDMPGFRKGHVPTDMALKKVGEVAVLEEAIEHFMRDFYPELVDAHTLDVVGRPEIRITSLPANGATGNPITLVVRSAVYPEVTLPKQWRAIAGKIEIETPLDVLDAEIDEALLSIQRARAKAANPTAPENAPGAEVKPENLPVLDDAFAKSLGNFTDLIDLKGKLRENMQQEKAQKAKETRRGKIVDALLEKTEVDIPGVFVESELDKIMNQLNEDVTRFGLTFEGYIKQVNKTEEQIREDFREQAKKRAKIQLTLNKIAADEKIEADKEAVEEEMKHALEHFPDARPELVRIHIETVLRNEKTLQLLESTEKKA